MNQCRFDNFFEQYPEEKAWRDFFAMHYSFWMYVTHTAKSLFNTPMNYPVQERIEEGEVLTSELRSLEDFFALYFLLIIYHECGCEQAKHDFASDQQLWKHLWQRELWSMRVTEEKFVHSLQMMKAELNRLGISKNPVNTTDKASLHL